MKTKENGVTLIALVITIILIIILASIGVTIGTSTLDSAAFTQFRSELKIMQNKVNELNQENKTDIEQELKDVPGLTEEQKNIFNITEITNIIFDGENNEEIQSGFRYFTKDDINTIFNLDSVKRDYFINVEYRYVIFPDGFEYEGTKYYMIDQIEGEIYNVRYNDKNDKTGNGSFEVKVTDENNKCKVEITNIDYSGYVDKWQVKYQLEGNSFWETSDDLTFYIKKEGTYNIKVTHGDEISLKEQKVRILYDGLISDKVTNEVIKVGDYVQYTPDEVTTTDETYINLISELGTYSGSTKNTTETLSQESLNWRVLDVENGKVRLISEVPTTSTVVLYGYNGYNNAVYLLDKTCSTLYNNSTYAKKVQNLKIEDIEKYMVTKPTISDTIYSPTNTYYPSILMQEKEQTVTANDGTVQPEIRLDFSEQTQPINQITTNTATLWGLKYTYWSKTLTLGTLEKGYYNLFMADEENNNFPTYWMSSRCVGIDDDYAYFMVRVIISSRVNVKRTYRSDDVCDVSENAAFRPVITLNSNIQIDATDITRDGTTPANAYILK